MITSDEIIAGMVEVVPVDELNGFRKIKETLTRMGVASKTEQVLNQSAHILHKKGKYYICHFKEMLALDGFRTDLSEGDLARRNRIVQMLSDWNLLKVVNQGQLDPMGHPNIVKVVKFADKDNWRLNTKYQMGINHV
jgi:hypothetical protein